MRKSYPMHILMNALKKKSQIEVILKENFLCACVLFAFRLQISFINSALDVWINWMPCLFWIRVLLTGCGLCIAAVPKKLRRSTSLSDIPAKKHPRRREPSAAIQSTRMTQSVVVPRSKSGESEGGGHQSRSKAQGRFEWMLVSFLLHSR